MQHPRAAPLPTAARGPGGLGAPSHTRQPRGLAALGPAPAGLRFNQSTGVVVVSLPPAIVLLLDGLLVAEQQRAVTQALAAAATPVGYAVVGAAFGVANVQGVLTANGLALVALGALVLVVPRVALRRHTVVAGLSGGAA